LFRHLILRNIKNNFKILEKCSIGHIKCLFCRIFRVASVASSKYIYSYKSKNREENWNLRLIRLRINKRAKMCFGRVNQRYEENMLTCADLLKNILRMQLLHLSSNAYLSLFFIFFPYFSPSLSFCLCNCTCTRKFTSKRLKKITPIWSVNYRILIFFFVK